MWAGRSKFMLVAALALGGCGGEPDQAPAGDLVVTASFVSTAQVGENRLDVEVATEAGDPVSNAEVKVEPFMPHHGHGSTADCEVTAMGDGHYDAFPVTLQMPGMWEVRVEATKGEQIGEVTLEVNVQ